MRRILAIASLAVRAAIRSRLFVCLLLLLLAAVIGLPLTVQSDGTPEGYVRLVLGYTMGFASVVLALTALWSGALTISREVADKQIQTLCSKPVHRLEIWIGKWLGLVAVHAVLLGLAAIATYATLMYALAGHRFTAEQKAHVRSEIWTARRPQIAPLPDVESAARTLLNDRIAHDLLPAGVSPDAALRNIRQELSIQALTVPPGDSLTWTFKLPAGLPSDAELRLKFWFSTSEMGVRPIQGTWLAGSSAANPAFRITTTNAPSTPQRIHFSSSCAQGSSTLVVRYVNDDPAGRTVVFPPSQRVELQTPAGIFPVNFVRAVLMVFCRLALFCAIGVAAGTLFSTPVAALMSFAAVIIVQCGSYIQSLTQQDRLTPWSVLGQSAPGLGDHLMRLFFRLLGVMIAPLNSGQPIDQAATGIIVEPFAVAGALLIQVVFYGGLLAALSTLVFNRRELALPSS